MCLCGNKTTQKQSYQFSFHTIIFINVGHRMKSFILFCSSYGTEISNKPLFIHTIIDIAVLVSADNKTCLQIKMGKNTTLDLNWDVFSY